MSKEEAYIYIFMNVPSCNIGYQTEAIYNYLSNNGKEEVTTEMVEEYINRRSEA